MTRPEDIPEEEFSPRPLPEQYLEQAFEGAITDARNTRTWPAVARWREHWMIGMAEPPQASLLNVAARYRTVGWHVVTDLNDRSIIATINRR